MHTRSFLKLFSPLLSTADADKREHPLLPSRRQFTVDRAQPIFDNSSVLLFKSH
jgi:hypothetical protein